MNISGSEKAALMQDSKGRILSAAALLLASMLQNDGLLLDDCCAVTHENVEHFARKLSRSPVRLGGLVATTADAEKLNTLSVVVVVRPSWQDDLGNAGAIFHKRCSSADIFSL
jgi:hypothetical protein